MPFHGVVFLISQKNTDILPMRPLLFLACSCIMLAAIVACHRTSPAQNRASPAKVEVEVNPGPPIPWPRDQIVGLKISLQDEESIEQMLFVDDETVALTIGTKAAVTAPLCYWKLNDGILVITSSPTHSYEELALISWSPTTLIAKRKDGRIATYAVQRITK